MTPVDHALDLSLLRTRQVSSLNNHIVLNTTTNIWQIDGKSINPATSLSQSQTLEGLFKTDTEPIKGLQTTCVASRPAEKQGQGSVWRTRQVVPRNCQEKLVHTLISALIKRTPVFICQKKLGDPLDRIAMD